MSFSLSWAGSVSVTTLLVALGVLCASAFFLQLAKLTRQRVDVDVDDGGPELYCSSSPYQIRVRGNGAKDTKEMMSSLGIDMPGIVNSYHFKAPWLVEDTALLILFESRLSI